MVLESARTEFESQLYTVHGPPSKDLTFPSTRFLIYNTVMIYLPHGIVALGVVN